MSDYAFTFGYDHDDIHAEVLGTTRASEGYLVIEAPNFHIAREIAFAIVGPRFSFQYDMTDGQWERDNQTKGYYPAGELLRIAWLTTSIDIMDRQERTREPFTGQSGEW